MSAAVTLAVVAGVAFCAGAVVGVVGTFFFFAEMDKKARCHQPGEG